MVSIVSSIAYYMRSNHNSNEMANRLMEAKDTLKRINDEKMKTDDLIRILKNSQDSVIKDYVKQLLAYTQHLFQQENRLRTEIIKINVQKQLEEGLSKSAEKGIQKLKEATTINWGA